MFKMFGKFILFLLLSPTLGNWNKDNFPKLPGDLALCNRENRTMSVTCDPDKILTEEHANVIDSHIENLLLNSTSPCDPDKGYKLGVAIVNNVQHDGQNTKEDTVKELAMSIHNSWGLGKEKCNDGILLFLSINDREMFISVGSGTKNKLGYYEQQTVMSSMKIHLRYNDPANAILTGISRMSEILKKEDSVGFLRLLWNFIKNPFVFILSLFAIMYAFMRNIQDSNNHEYVNKEYLECKEKLTELQKDKSKALAKKYKATSCPVCLEKFKGLENDINKSILSCGHSFHDNCINKWFEDNKTCPICRKEEIKIKETPEKNQDSNIDDHPSSLLRRMAAHRRHESSLIDNVNSNYDQELRFRLNNLSSRYPSFINSSLIDELCYPDIFDFTSRPSFMNCCPVQSNSFWTTTSQTSSNDISTTSSTSSSSRNRNSDSDSEPGLLGLLFSADWSDGYDSGGSSFFSSFGGGSSDNGSSSSW